MEKERISDRFDDRAKERGGGRGVRSRIKGRKGKPSENGAVEQNEKERRGSLTLSLESDSSQSQYSRSPCSHLLACT